MDEDYRIKGGTIRECPSCLGYMVENNTGTLFICHICGHKEKIDVEDLNNNVCPICGGSLEKSDGGCVICPKCHYKNCEEGENR